MKKLLILLLVFGSVFGCTQSEPKLKFDIVCYSGGVEIDRTTADYTTWSNGEPGIIYAYLGDEYVGTYSRSMCIIRAVGQ